MTGIESSMPVLSAYGLPFGIGSRTGCCQSKKGEVSKPPLPPKKQSPSPDNSGEGDFQFRRLPGQLLSGGDQLNV